VGPVTKQSEHLSSAQIENYGIRTSGAGPETAQRDERQRPDHQGSGDPRVIDQRVTDQSASDQRVEAHLADCASCRNRLLDFHRSLFASSTYPPEPDRPKAADLKNDPKNGPPEHDTSPSSHSSSGDSPSGYSASGHLPSGQRPADSSLEGTKPTDSALADSKFANPKYPVQAQVRTAATPECPSDDALRELAAGLTSDDAAPALTRHAATCDHCGPLLRTYTEIFSADFGPEEQAALANLQSSSASWQKNTARQMLQAAATIATGAAGAAEASAAETGGSHATATVKPGKKPSAGRPASSASDRKPFFWKWVLVPATAAVVAVAAFSIWYTQRDTPEKVEALLAQGATEQRKVEMRIPNAKHADFAQTRGESESRLNSPASLSRAAEQISEHLKKDPDDSKWLILSARLDLLDWNYKPALSSLEKISDAHVVESPEFLMTRAFALYEKSEVLKENQGYFEAVNLLAKALQNNPNDPVLLFNQAIACEKIHAYECAQGDWNRFLTIEKDPDWISEARKHLQQIEEKNLAP
jgi:hypothetical protein